MAEAQDVGATSTSALVVALANATSFTLAEAAGWQQGDIEKCLIQAQHRRRGFSNDEERVRLHSPRGWCGSVDQEDAHSPTVVEDDGDLSACTS